jgi:phospholipase C
MDGFVTDAGCADPRNWAIAPDTLVKPYHDLAFQNAVADRYFQPIAGASSSNDLYLAVAKEVFIDDAYEPNVAGSQCSSNTNATLYTGQTTIADLLESAGKTITWYAEGLAAMQAADGGCPAAPSACAHALPSYPCVFDPADIPLLYYAQFAGDGGVVKDYSELAGAFDGGTLPDVSFVKALGYHSEHPGSGTSIVAGVSFVTDLVQAVGASGYKDTTLVLLTWDEGGGFFDHVPPPAKSAVDDMPYGTRVPLLAIGHYARQGAVSHVQMEHASIVKFLEWNFLGGSTGQLQARDALVNNIGSLLDPAKTATPVPVQ